MRHHTPRRYLANGVISVLHLLRVRGAQALEQRKEDFDQASAHYAEAKDLYEAQYNAAMLAERRGDFQACHASVRHSCMPFNALYLATVENRSSLVSHLRARADCTDR
jgi:hypothetical protein